MYLVNIYIYIFEGLCVSERRFSLELLDSQSTKACIPKMGSLFLCGAQAQLNKHFFFAENTEGSGQKSCCRKYPFVIM